MRLIPVLIFACAGTLTAADPAGVRTIASGTGLLAREITRPTAANLDWAVYSDNPLLVEPAPKPDHFAGQTKKPALADLKLAEAIDAGSLTDPPPKDLGQPLVWQPLLNRLRIANEMQSASLVDLGYQVAKEKWGTRRATQAISSFYHGATPWIQITFRRGFETDEIHDDDGDGLAECFAKIAPETVAAVNDALHDYTSRVLAIDEIDRQINEIAGALYDQHYVFARDTRSFSPEQDLDDATRASLGEFAKKQPAGLIERPALTEEGHPTPGRFVCLLYLAPPKESATAPLRRSLIQVADSIPAALAAFRKDLASALAAEPLDSRVIKAPDGTLFFRRALEYLAADDLATQPTNPIEALTDFAKQLKARGIEFVFVPIPVKATIYPDWLSAHSKEVVPNVAGRQLFDELRKVDVRVLDPGDALRDERRRNPNAPLYLKTDTHWTPLGAAVVARWVGAELLKTGAASGAEKFTEQPTEVAFVGNLTNMLPEDERAGISPEKHAAVQVIDSKGVPLGDRIDDAPVLVLGDSYLTIYQREQCGSAGFAAHLAKTLGQPVDMIAAQGGGPQTRVDLARRGADYLTKKKIVILAMSERDMFKSFGGWKPVQLP
jgi:alginate O-acetyltransferase complex protein AlgJ